MKNRVLRILEILKEDWLLVVVALSVSILIWWNVTQRQMITKFLPAVEVNLDENLKPSLRLSDRQELKPKVSVRVEGPRVYLDTMTSSSFQINADLSGIAAATRTQVFLKPKDFVLKSYLVAGGIPADQFRVVNTGGISPGSVVVETVWNETVVNIVPRIGGRPARGYVLAATKVTPATLTVAGAQADILQLRSVHNKNEIVIQREKGLVVKQWTLDDLDLGNLEVLDWKPSNLIRLEMSIAPQYLDKRFNQVQVRILDATADSLLYDLHPSTVDVHVQGFRPSVLEATNTSFALGVSLAGLGSGTHHLISTRFRPIDLPNDVEIKQVTPSTVSLYLWDVYGPSQSLQGSNPRIPTPSAPSLVSPTDESLLEGLPTAASDTVSATAPVSATVESASP